MVVVPGGEAGTVKAIEVDGLVRCEGGGEWGIVVAVCVAVLHGREGNYMGWRRQGHCMLGLRLWWCPAGRQGPSRRLKLLAW